VKSAGRSPGASLDAKSVASCLLGAALTALATTEVAVTGTTLLRTLTHLGTELVEPRLLLRRQDRANLGLHRRAELLALRSVRLHRRTPLLARCAGSRGITTLAGIARCLHVSTGRRVQLLELRAVTLVNRADLGALGLGQIERVSDMSKHHARLRAMIAALRTLTTLSLSGAGRDGEKSRNCTDSEDLHGTNLQL
jgi:hypothetical protein